MQSPRSCRPIRCSSSSPRAKRRARPIEASGSSRRQGARQPGPSARQDHHATAAEPTRGARHPPERNARLVAAGSRVGAHQRGAARRGGGACGGDRPRRPRGADRAASQARAGDAARDRQGRGDRGARARARSGAGHRRPSAHARCSSAISKKAWSAKVLDRTGLILEIFGERAQTKEGRLQVELAHLNYQKGRLVRSWTHLERQRGGFGFLGGPGETQIEADRRQIETRIKKIEGELTSVTNMRSVHRAERKRVPRPIVALGRLHERRQVDALQPADRRRHPRQGHAFRDARPDAPARAAAARRGDDPLRHGRLHLRTADHAGRRLPRHAGGGDGGRPDPACARHRLAGHAAAGGGRHTRFWASSASTAARGGGSSRSGTRSTGSIRRSAKHSGRRRRLPNRRRCSSRR